VSRGYKNAPKRRVDPEPYHRQPNLATFRKKYPDAVVPQKTPFSRKNQKPIERLFRTIYATLGITKPRLRHHFHLTSGYQPWGLLRSHEGVAIVIESKKVVILLDFPHSKFLTFLGTRWHILGYSYGLFAHQGPFFSD